MKLKNLKEVYGNLLVEIFYYIDDYDSTGTSKIGVISEETETSITLDLSKNPCYKSDANDSKLDILKFRIEKIVIYNDDNDPLKFLGRGSCFNVAEGNTSAYFETSKAVYLIDCGETVFEKIMSLQKSRKSVIKEDKAINIIITHMHSDHVGSLPSLIFYCNYVLNKVVNILYPNKWTITAYLTLCGVPEELYVVHDSLVNTNYSATISFHEEDHHLPNSFTMSIIDDDIIDADTREPFAHIMSLKDMTTPSYGLSIYLLSPYDKKLGKNIYYSSDTATPLAGKNMSEFESYDYFYYDASLRETNSKGDKYPHCNLYELVKKFNENKIPLDKLRLMHIDDYEVIEVAEVLNIQCVKVEQ